MKRRWKVGMALAVVGLAGFLIWAFRSPPTPPLTIRFAGYLTNGTPSFERALPPGAGYVFAVFAVTNHSAHNVTVGATALVEFNGHIMNKAGQWLNKTNYTPGRGSHYNQLNSGEGSRVATSFISTDDRIIMTVADYTDHGGNTWWNRIRRQLPKNRQRPRASATNELR